MFVIWKDRQVQSMTQHDYNSTLFSLFRECLSLCLHEILIVFQPSCDSSAMDCRVTFGTAARKSCGASNAQNDTATGAACGSTWTSSAKWNRSTPARTATTEPGYPPCWSTTLFASMQPSPRSRRHVEISIMIVTRRALLTNDCNKTISITIVTRKCDTTCRNIFPINCKWASRKYIHFIERLSRMFEYFANNPSFLEKQSEF